MHLPKTHVRFWLGQKEQDTKSINQQTEVYSTRSHKVPRPVAKEVLQISLTYIYPSSDLKSTKLNTHACLKAFSSVSENVF